MKILAEFKVPTTGEKDKKVFNKYHTAFTDYAVINVVALKEQPHNHNDQAN